ncbi:hypothetical protein [Streptomyces sp. BE133]|uniref:hypothetical protein n=1 Tax=Streptomyces sp. BE133 TaxID=3002523 RepID=UPI002E79EEE0|nr:hypothetical protein [Streptomyces sp. BE133]MEE1808278.1 hypothetical protein [Streptomyces sp. BE133]
MPEEVTDTRPPRTWIAPLISTVVTLPLAFFAWVFGGLSPMACDSCSEADSDRFDTSFDPAWTVLTLGLMLALITLVTSWALSRHRPPAALALAVLAPGVVFFAWVTFMALVDWP